MFVFLYLGVCAAGAVAILVDSSLQGVDLTAFQSLADSASLLGGAGPGLGFAGPMGSFAPFSDVSTLVLTAADVPRPARDHPGARALHGEPLACVGS